MLRQVREGPPPPAARLPAVPRGGGNLSAAHVLAQALDTTRGRAGVWYPVARDCLAALGGEADLAAIYTALQAKRPTQNPHWRKKVCQQLQRAGPGRYRLQCDTAAVAA